MRTRDEIRILRKRIAELEEKTRKLESHSYVVVTDKYGWGHEAMLDNVISAILSHLGLRMRFVKQCDTLEIINREEE